MTECQFLKNCPQWITQTSYIQLCEEKDPEFSYGSCRKYLDLHSPNRTDTKRARDWKNLLEKVDRNREEEK